MSEQFVTKMATQRWDWLTLVWRYGQLSLTDWYVMTVEELEARGM